MRRIDLAEKINITASGITRMLLPMEKIGLVKSGPAENDARVRFVLLSKNGQEKLKEAQDRSDVLLEEVLIDIKSKDIVVLSDLFYKISGKILMD